VMGIPCAPLRMAISAATLVAWVAISSSAHAKETEHAAVVVSGKADAATLKQIETVTSQYLRNQGWSLAENVGAAMDVAAFSTCVRERKPKCVAQLAAPLGVETILLVSASPERSSDGVDAVVLTAWFLASTDGSVRAINRRYCERCSVPQMDEAVTALVDGMLRVLIARQGFGVVRVRSTPPGALVLIDGKAVGRADPGTEFGVSIGPHEVELELDGYKPTVRSISVMKDGLQLNLDLKLEPGQGAGGTDPTDSRSGSALKWVVGGGGALLVAGGIYLLAIDGSESTDAGNRLAVRDDTTLAGVSTIAIGAVALGFSGYLFYRDSRSSTRAAVAVDGQHLWLGLAGSF
jgi:hypothetical protein